MYVTVALYAVALDVFNGLFTVDVTALLATVGDAPHVTTVTHISQMHLAT